MAKTEKFDRGSPVIIPVTFYDNSNPHSETEVLIDPTSPTVTIRDPKGTAQITAQALSKTELGKYTYVCQTATDWLTGEYEVQINATSGSYTDITIDVQNFILK